MSTICATEGCGHDLRDHDFMGSLSCSHRARSFGIRGRHDCPCTRYTKPARPVQPPSNVPIDMGYMSLPVEVQDAVEEEYARHAALKKLRKFFEEESDYFSDGDVEGYWSIDGAFEPEALLRLFGYGGDGNVQD